MGEVSPLVVRLFLPALALLSTLLARPLPASAWSSYNVSSYTLDISLENEGRAVARLTLEIEVQGGRFRGFKIARGDEGLTWAPSSMYCENTSGKRYVLRRVSRADGLTDMRFVTPGYIPRGNATCSMEYTFDPSELGAIQLVVAGDPGADDSKERVRFSYKTPGLPDAVEQFVVTLHLPAPVSPEELELGAFVAEEYTVEHYPSAVTMRRYRPPAYYTGLVEVTLPYDVLLGSTGGVGATGSEGIVHVERFIGIPPESAGTGPRRAWLFALLALATLVIVAVKHRASERADGIALVRHPHLLFPGSRPLTRLGVSGMLLLQHPILAGAGRYTAALVCLSAALFVNLRAGLVLTGARPETTGPWVEADPGDARARLRAARRRESIARRFLDATTAPGLALLASATAGLFALRLVVLPDAPATAIGLTASGGVVLAFTFLTSTRLGGYGQLASRTLRRLMAVRRQYAIIGEQGPALCLRDDPGRGRYPDMRLRQPLGLPGWSNGAFMEVGVEWTHGWCAWRPSLAVVLELDARTGALVADAPWLERAEIHARIKEGRTAIVVRGLDPALPLIVQGRIGEMLRRPASPTSATEAALRLVRGAAPAVVGEKEAGNT